MKTSFFKEIMGNKSPQIHELTINYRSHSGVLNLAQCVLRILEKNYPHAIDRVPSDNGMFPGPTPKFIKPCNPDFLKLMIAANARDPVSEIGVLGFHQAVIVRDEKSKDESPFDKDEDLMFTIYEAKGLEYDDVLLYNFFSGCAEVRSSCITNFIWKLVLLYIVSILYLLLQDGNL
jgi:ATP-dependent exoDNAse (exonuclease V) beta subunit